MLETVALWSVPWGLGVPADTPDGPAEIADYADRTWIVNSRNTADEDAVRTLASLAGFAPRIAHEIDSLELVEDLIVAGYGVGLLPIGTANHRRCQGASAVRTQGHTHRLRGDAPRPGDLAAAAHGTGPDAPPAGNRTAPPEVAAAGSRAEFIAPVR